MSDLLGVAAIILMLASAVYFLALMFDYHTRVANIQSGLMFAASSGLVLYPDKHELFLAALFLTMSWIMLRRVWLCRHFRG